MKTIIETRTLSMDDLRELCIKNNYYTEGTNDEYDRFLTSVKGVEITKDKIYYLAVNIFTHSDIEDNGLSTDEIVASIMYNIAEICHTVFTVY